MLEIFGLNCGLQFCLFAELTFSHGRILLCEFRTYLLVYMYHMYISRASRTGGGRMTAGSSSSSSGSSSDGSDSESSSSDNEEPSKEDAFTPSTRKPDSPPSLQVNSTFRKGSLMAQETPMTCQCKAPCNKVVRKGLH